MVDDWEALQDEIAIIVGGANDIYAFILEVSKGTNPEISKHIKVCRLLVNYIQDGDPTLEVLLDESLIEEAERLASSLMVDRLESLLQKTL